MIEKDLREAVSEMNPKELYDKIQLLKQGQEVKIGDRVYKKHDSHLEENIDSKI